MAAVFPPVSGGSASQASVSDIQADIGDPSGSATSLYDSLKYLYQTADATLASVIQDSIIAHILASSGTVSNFDDTTDSLEALANKQADIETDTQNIQDRVGDPASDGTSVHDSLKYLYQQTAGASMASVIQDSIIAHILASSGTVSNFDDTTDSLEALGTKTDKIDGLAVDGLLGVYNSLAYLVSVLEVHHHSREYWYGQDSNNFFFKATSATAWQMTSSATVNTFGPAIQLSDGNEVESGDSTKYYDLHRLYVKAASVQDKVYRLRFKYATAGTAGTATVLTETIYVKADNTLDQVPVEIMSPRITCNNKLWCQTACETGSGTIDLLVGIHTYQG